MSTGIEAATHDGAAGPSRIFRSAVVHAVVSAVLVALGGACITAPGAWAAVPAPALKVAAATGPTNLPIKQSEVQRITVGAKGGTFTLGMKSGEGEGTPVTVTGGKLTFSAASTTAEVASEGIAFEVGDVVSGLGIRAGTEILSCSPDCSKEGSTLSLSVPTRSAETAHAVTIVTGELSDVSGGPFFPGDEISSSRLSGGAVVLEVSGTTLKLSRAPSSSLLQVVMTASEQTSPLAYDASAGAVQSALEALPAFGAKTFTVSGGPGGSAASPYFVDFGGALADQNVEELAATGEGLGTHGYVAVSTATPGGPGSGQVGIFLTNVGGVATGGRLAVHLGPLPSGIVTSGPASGEGWSCVTEEREATCTTSESLEALHETAPVNVPVEVQGATGADLEAQVTASYGGGVQSSYRLPIVVSATPAGPGLAAFWTEPVEADGTPATQAGGHPYALATWFMPNVDRGGAGGLTAAGDLKYVKVALPPGLLGNPMVAERCPQALATGGSGTGLEEAHGGCQYAGSTVGGLEPYTSFDEKPIGLSAIHDDLPVEGAAAQFASVYGPAVVSLFGGVRSSEDFGVSVTSPNIASTSSKTFSVYTVFYGLPEAASGKAFFRSPSDCSEEAREAPGISIEASTWQQPTSFATLAQSLPAVTGCDKLKFEAYDAETKEGQVSFSFQPTSTTGSSPVGATAHLHIDQSGLTDSSKLATPDLKESVVKLPAGFSINPAQASGLAACSEAQVGYLGEGALPNPTRFDEEPVTCPDASKLGTAEVTTPLLDEPLQGTVYLAAQDENPFHSLIALYLVIESKRFGLTLKLPGKVETNPETGQVTAVFDHVPQQPVEDLTLKFRGGGGRSEFATPEVCGTYTTSGEWTPWSAPESGPAAVTEDSFTVSSGCSASLAARPFEPGFEAGTVTPSAGSYSPLVIKLSRKDGEQELTHLDLTLPDGLLGKLAGVERCSDAAIAAAGSVSGREELAKPSCPEGSLLGSVDAASGVGGEPIHVPGKVYLAGPYEGGPYSVVVVTPAVAGPFDLGDVVVRAPLFVDKATSQVSTRSDAIPTILDGIPLKIRSIAIDIDRPSFTLNPTSCEVMSVTGTAAGSSGASSSLSSRFQVGGCEGLAFKPSFTASTSAKTSRKKGASLTVKLGFPAGAEANLAKAKVQLPIRLPSRLATLNQACTEEQFAKDPAGCPQASVVGSASAVTPILASPLTGPAYFVSHGGAKFPELILILQGEGITIQLSGETFIAKGITTSTFNAVPDAPVSSFTLSLPTGEHSALAAPAGHLCRHRLIMPTTLTAQNGMTLRQNTRIHVQGCPEKLEVVSHRLKGKTITLKVTVPAAGKLVAKGKGLARASRSSSGAATLTLRLKEHKHTTPNNKTKINLAFTPTTGKTRKQLKTSVVVKRKA